jgi:hypothetical protein
VLHCKAAAILDTMWGNEGKAPGWFRINEYNHSGRRLYWLLGHKDLWVTNACRDQVYSAAQHGTPDPVWLSKNLQRLQYDLLLVCGRVAQRTFAQCVYRPKCCIIEMPHPASRTWTRAALLSFQELIQNAR